MYTLVSMQPKVKNIFFLRVYNIMVINFWYNRKSLADGQKVLESLYFCRLQSNDIIVIFPRDFA